MGSVADQWHLAAARVSPLIWEIQKAKPWDAARARERLRVLPKLSKQKDYVGILTSEPELESMRDRLVIVPVNYEQSVYGHAFLVEREREVEVLDWDGKSVFRGELDPEQSTDFLRWCAGHFVRIVGLRPPVQGP